jgi:DNA-binding NarL/FixJ family response regulator
VRMAAESELVARATPDPLTPRELEILSLVARGHTNREIAGRLIVAVGTIKVHVEHILGKLGAADRTQAAVRAVELGIVHGEDGPPLEQSH